MKIRFYAANDNGTEGFLRKVVKPKLDDLPLKLALENVRISFRRLPIHFG